MEMPFLVRIYVICLSSEKCFLCWNWIHNLFLFKNGKPVAAKFSITIPVFESASMVGQQPVAKKLSNVAWSLPTGSTINNLGGWYKTKKKFVRSKNVRENPHHAPQMINGRPVRCNMLLYGNPLVNCLNMYKREFLNYMCYSTEIFTKMSFHSDNNHIVQSCSLTQNFFQITCTNPNTQKSEK